jgi:uncharacterized SAM-binding protein YcdF (DUF218 family)
MFFEAGAGMLLGFFSWIGYERLSIIDPLGARGINGMLVFALLGGLLYRTKARAILWAIPAAIAFMILLVSYTPIIVNPARGLIRTDSMSTVDAVVVLSSGVSDDQVLDQQGTDRLLTGLGVARRMGAKTLVVTLLAMDGTEGALTSKYDQLRLYYLAQAPVKLVMIPSMGNTHGEAMQTARLASERGWKRIGVVTSPLHSKRACATFEKAGFSVVCVPALSRDLAVGTLRGAGDRLRAFQLWLYESLATSEYKRRNWI